MKKVVTIAELNRILGSREKNVALTGGEFGFIFPEHIDLFNYTREKGDITVVLVKETESQIPLKERLEILDSINLIDYIITSGETSMAAAVRKLDKLETIVLNKEFKLSENELKGIKNTEYFGN